MNIIKSMLSVMLKIILASLSICIALFLAKFLLFPSIRTFFELEELQFKIIEQLLTLFFIGLAYWLYVKYYEKRIAFELSFNGPYMLYGALSGALLITITSLTLFSFGYYEIVEYQGFENFAVIASTIILIATLEEFVFRGILFRIIEEKIGTLYSISFVSALFGSIHLFNENTSLMTVFSVTLLGFFWGGVYLLSRNIWVTGINHSAWNLAIFSTGIPLSGNEDWIMNAPFESVYSGPILITGGKFGPEDSLINIVVLLITCAVIYRIAKKKSIIVGYSHCRLHNNTL